MELPLTKWRPLERNWDISYIIVTRELSFSVCHECVQVFSACSYREFERNGASNRYIPIYSVFFTSKKKKINDFYINVNIRIIFFYKTYNTIDSLFLSFSSELDILDHQLLNVSFFFRRNSTACLSPVLATSEIH